MKRLTAALVLAVMLAAPAVARAAGPTDQDTISRILNQIARHSCAAAAIVAKAWGLKPPMCAEEAPPAEEIPPPQK